MKVFIALLCVAATQAQWFGYHHPTMYTMPLVKPVEIKPEEYTKTMEYKTGFPHMYSGLYYNNWAYPYHKLAKMPEVETDYAAKGEYRAEAAGDVVHVAKRSADPLWYNNWNAYPYTTYAHSPIAHPFTYNNWAYPYHQIAKMPEVETDYASKGEYRAEAAGGVVHVAKRSADPLWYNNWNAYPYTTYAHTPIHYNYNYPYMFPIMPKMVHDDRSEETPEYANKGEYVAESAGVVHLAKRDADAQLLLRSSNIINPYTYTTTPYINNFYGTRHINGYNRFAYNRFNNFGRYFI